MLGSIEFGKWLQQLRKKAGLNQEELAEQVGVHYNTVSQWENGKYTPNTAKIKSLATVLNVSESDLLNGPVKQEFEVKILMGVKSLANVAGLEIKDDSFFYGVDDEKPEIHIGGRVNIATIEDREKALKKITESFLRACWMFDHRDEAGLAIQPA